MFQFNQEQLCGNLKDELDFKWVFKPREFFQKFGTEYGQFILPEHFPELSLILIRDSFGLNVFGIGIKRKRKRPIFKGSY